MAQREIPFRPRAGTCGSHSTTQKQQLSSSPTMTLMGGPSVSSITGSIGSTDHSFIKQRHGGEATTITSLTAPFELPEDLQLHIEDTFALAHQLRLFNGALKGQLDFIVFSADESEMAPDYIQDAIVLWQTTLASLNTQGLLGYESAELYINSRNFMNYTETVPTLNFAEAELESFLGAIASFERCIMDDERKMWRELAHTLASSSDEGNRSAKVLNLRLKLGASRLVRAEARRDLEVVVADLCTPSLAAFQYLPNPRTEQEHTAMLSTSLPPPAAGLSGLSHQNGFTIFSAPSDPQNAEVSVCVLCDGDIVSDPIRDDEHARSQLSIGTLPCCKSGPSHVYCMLCHMDDSLPSKVTCPNCDQVLGDAFL